MGIERDAGQSRYVYLVLQRIINALGKQGVQRVDTLDNENTIAGEVESFAIILTLACYKVILWHFNRFTLHQAREMVT